MFERRAAVVRLLRVRDEGLPVDGRVAGPVAAAGFVHGTLAPVVCPVCEGLAEGFCPGCGGRGYVEEWRSRDPYASEVVVPFGWDVGKHEAARERERQIAVLAAQTRPAPSEATLLAEANRRGYAWEDRRKALYRDFDLAALDRALDELRGVDDQASRALHAVFVYGWLPVERAPVAIVERGLRFLEGRLPDPLRSPEPVVEPVSLAPRGRGVSSAMLEGRDREIRRRVLVLGEASVVVAAMFGLSVAQVNRIVARGDVAATS